MIVVVKKPLKHISLGKFSSLKIMYDRNKPGTLFSSINNTDALYFYM
jgi:hypothetical protein